MDVYLTEREVGTIRQLITRISIEDRQPVKRRNRITNLSRRAGLILTKAERRSERYPVV